jgi:hypothetical protein
VRCGVDDGPVPISRGSLDDLRPTARADARRSLVSDRAALFGIVAEEPSMRVRAALPEVEQRASFEGGQIPAAALGALFAECMFVAETTDSGEIALDVSFASTGAPLTVSPRATVLSPYGRCLAESACRVPPQPTLAGGMAVARVATTVTPPVFRGTAVVTGNVLGTVASLKGRLLRPAEANTALGKLTRVAQAVALGCARELPPAGDVTLVFSVTMLSANPAIVEDSGAVDHAGKLHACLRAGLPLALGPSPFLGAAQLVVSFAVPVPPSP